MDISSIELPGSELEGVIVEGDQVRVRFSTAYIIKTIDGSRERTRWRQQGDLVFDGAEVVEELPALPGVCAGGDVVENIYTYRDMVPIPLESHGRASCDLRFEGSDQHLKIEAEGVRLEMKDRPHYIEHIRPE
jgi:hypothetical protein